MHSLAIGNVDLMNESRIRPPSRNEKNFVLQVYIGLRVEPNILHFHPKAEASYFNIQSVLTYTSRIGQQRRTLHTSGRLNKHKQVLTSKTLKCQRYRSFPKVSWHLRVVSSCAYCTGVRVASHAFHTDNFQKESIFIYMGVQPLICKYI